MVLSYSTVSSLLLVATVFVPVVLVVGVLMVSTSPASMKRRIARVAGRRLIQTGEPGSTPTGSLRRMPVGTVSGRIGRMLVELLPHGEVVQARLEQAGVRLGVADVGIAWLLLIVVTTSALRVWMDFGLLISIGVSIIVWVIFTTIIFKRRIGTRRLRFLRQFPDAVDLIVRGVRSGLPVTEALHAVGHEFHGEVADLFRDIGAGIRLGKGLNEALSLATERVDVQELRFFAISLAIQQETGGNLGEILHNLSSLMRRREQLKMKIKAMSSEARASAMIIGSLPFIMFFVIYFLDPDYITKLFVDPRGLFLLGAGLTSLLVGLTVMSKMVRFEI